MAAPLSIPQRNEIEELSRQYGPALHIEAEIFPGFHNPIRKTDRVGEVCMVIRRPNGKLLLSIKKIYPRGAYRLPTGGVGVGEPILAALLREVNEETGLSVRVTRFLANITYRVAGEQDPVFHTFAFLLDETGGTLAVTDPDELIEEYIEIDPAELPRVADRLSQLAPKGTAELVGGWRDWGKFRAVVHRTVHEALSER